MKSVEKTEKGTLSLQRVPSQLTSSVQYLQYHVLPQQSTLFLSSETEGHIVALPHTIDGTPTVPHARLARDTKDPYYIYHGSKVTFQQISIVSSGSPRTLDMCVKSTSVHAGRHPCRSKDIDGFASSTLCGRMQRPEPCWNFTQALDLAGRNRTSSPDPPPLLRPMLTEPLQHAVLTKTYLDKSDLAFLD